MSDIEVRDLPRHHTAVIRRRLPLAEASRIPEFILQTLNAIKASGQEPAGMPFIRSFSMAGDPLHTPRRPVAAPSASASDGGASPESGSDVSASTLPAGPAAVVSYFGPYEEIGPVCEAIRAWCAEHGREIAGPPWESYFTAPHEEPDPAKWGTDVHFPLTA